MFNLKIFTFVLLLLSSLSANAFYTFTPLNSFGDNPGDLTASTYFSSIEATPLVVLLHGCVQNGEQLAEQMGLLSLAKKKKFNLLIPQQLLSNNPKSCFNWYSPQDTQHDQGELLSIKNMILTTQAQTNASDVYIVGVSAGGAMSSALLVNYPEMFNAGAVIAGIPFPCASDLIQAISCMKNGPSESASKLAKKAMELQEGTHDAGTVKWPRLSVWTGINDSIVNPKNSISLAQQWALLKGINKEPLVIEENGYRRSQWQNTKQPFVELVELSNLDHGVPVNPTIEHGGEIAPFLLNSPLSAAVSIINFWNL